MRLSKVDTANIAKLQVTTMAAPKPELQFICMVPLPGF